MGCFLLKFAKILICTILMVAILSVPCFATNVGIYEHVIMAGTYRFNVELNNSYLLPNVDYLFKFSAFDEDGSYRNLYGIRKNVNGYIIYYLYRDAGQVEYNLTVYNDNGWVNDDSRLIELTDDIYTSDANFYAWFMSNAVRVTDADSSDIVSEFGNVFIFVGQWISGAVEDLTVLFWSDNSLTFVGFLTVASLAMAVSFLIIGLISRFLRFRG